jgi:hypothetical protein
MDLRRLCEISPFARFFAGEGTGGEGGDGGAGGGDADGGGGAGGGGSTEINFHELIGADGSIAEGFFLNEKIPEHIRNNPTVKATKNIISGFDQLVNSQKLIGVDKIPMPGPNAPKEVWDQVWSKLGKPADVKGYTPLKVDGATEAEKAFGAKLMESALAADMTKGQWDKFSKQFSEAAQALVQTEQQAAKEQKVTYDQATQKEWPGPAFAENMKNAEAVLNSLCSLEEQKALREIGLLDHPAGRFLLKRVFDKVSEMEPGGGQGGGSPTGASVTDARAELSALLTDLKGPLHVAHHPGHAQALKRAELLRTIIRKG